MPSALHASPLGAKDDDHDHQRERGDFVGDDDDEDEGTGTDKDGDGGKAGTDADDGKGKDKGGSDDDADDDADGDAGASDGEKRTVPYGRFKEVNDRNIELEDENRRLKAGQGGGGKKEDVDENDPANITDPAKLRKMARDALLEGDTEKAAQLDSRADDILVERAADRVERRNAQKEINDAAAIAREKYPWLDHNNTKARDPESIAEVVALRDTYIARGMKPGAALTKAADKVAKTRDDYEAEDEDDKGKGKGKGDGKNPEEERTQRAIRRGAKAADAQPPVIGGKGNRTGEVDVPDVAKMTDKQFRDMPEEERARARGDTL